METIKDLYISAHRLPTAIRPRSTTMATMKPGTSDVPHPCNRSRTVEDQQHPSVAGVAAPNFKDISAGATARHHVRTAPNTSALFPVGGDGASGARIRTGPTYIAMPLGPSWGLFYWSKDGQENASGLCRLWPPSSTAIPAAAILLRPLQGKSPHPHPGGPR